MAIWEPTESRHDPPTQPSIIQIVGKLLAPRRADLGHQGCKQFRKAPLEFAVLGAFQRQPGEHPRLHWQFSVIATGHA